jgi:hypothetical protein
MINTPKMDAILDKVDPRRVNRFADAKKTIEEGLAAKHIWNVDYEDAKGVISSAWERVDGPAHEYLTKLYYHDNPNRYRSWLDNDPRYNMGLTQLLNTPGFLNRLKSVKNAPELKDYLEVLSEVAELASQIKAVKPFIEKGRKPSLNPPVIDLTGTGHCAVCNGLFKIDGAAKMVHHGFQISGGTGHYFGQRLGSCFGVGYKPYELSSEGCVAYEAHLQKVLANTKDNLAQLQSDDLENLQETVQKRVEGRYVPESVTRVKGTPEFDRLRERYIHQTEYQISGLEQNIEIMNAMITNWKLKPLPHGERVVKAAK